MRIAIFIRPGRRPGSFQAFSPDLSGCAVSASSPAEATELLRARIAQQLAGTRNQSVPAGVQKLEIEL